MTQLDQPARLTPGPAPVRIGNVERQQAMDALDVHMSAGRLDPEEYGERVAQASVARTVVDLEPLFADLPAPHATATVTPAAEALGPSAVAPPAAGWLPPPSAPSGRGRPRSDGRDPLGGRIGEITCAVSPLVALVLFFLGAAIGFEEAWLFFLLIPIVGAVVYGRDGHDHRDRGRNRRR